MLRANRGFAQSRDCPTQTLDPWFLCAISRLPLYFFTQSTRTRVFTWKQLHFRKSRMCKSANPRCACVHVRKSRMCNSASPQIPDVHACVHVRKSQMCTSANRRCARHDSRICQKGNQGASLLRLYRWWLCAYLKIVSHAPFWRPSCAWPLPSADAGAASASD